MSVVPEEVSRQLSNPTQLGTPFQLPDTSAIDAEVAADRKREQEYETKSLDQSQRLADLEEQQAQQITQQQQSFDNLLKQYPTRDVAYGTAMHNAPVLAIMTALGGKLTRLNGLEMLGATNGIMAGLNQGAENQFKESLDKWNAAYQRQKDLFDEQQRARQLMLTAYAGRADAYQKAAEAARRMTGDMLLQKQENLKNQIDLFKVQQSQLSQLERSKEAWARIAIQRDREQAQTKRWNALVGSSTDPRVKAQMLANQHEWQNLNSQVNQLEKRAGQISNEIELTAAEKQTQLSYIDSQVASLQSQMDAVVQRGEQLALTMPTPNAPATEPKGGPLAFQTKEDVLNAVKSKQLSWLQAHQILQNQFGMTQ